MFWLINIDWWCKVHHSCSHLQTFGTVYRKCNNHSRSPYAVSNCLNFQILTNVLFGLPLHGESKWILILTSVLGIHWITSGVQYKDSSLVVFHFNGWNQRCQWRFCGRVCYSSWFMQQCRCSWNQLHSSQIHSQFNPLDQEGTIDNKDFSFTQFHANFWAG